MAGPVEGVTGAAAAAGAVCRCYVLLVSNYLVDPASSHMLVSKIKPCMCQYRPKLRQNREWLIKSVMIHLMMYLLLG